MDKLKGLANKLGHKGEGNTAADPNAPASNADVSVADFSTTKSRC